MQKINSQSEIQQFSTDFEVGSPALASQNPPSGEELAGKWMFILAKYDTLW